MQLPAHDWFSPKLADLLAQAEQAGYGRDVAVAVITDLVNGALSGAASLPDADEKWAQDIAEPTGASQEMPHGQTPSADSFGDQPTLDVLPGVQGRGLINRVV